MDTKHTTVSPVAAKVAEIVAKAPAAVEQPTAATTKEPAPPKTLHCAKCGNVITENTTRVELIGIVVRKSFDNGGSRLQTIASNSVYCNVNCFGASVCRPTV